jgi:hypothetical protein
MTMKPIIPRPLPDGSIVIAQLPAGSKIVAHPVEGWIAAHPDHKPLWIHWDGITETIDQMPTPTPDGEG